MYNVDSDLKDGLIYLFIYCQYQFGQIESDILPSFFSAKAALNDNS